MAYRTFCFAPLWHGFSFLFASVISLASETVNTHRVSVEHRLKSERQQNTSNL